MVGPLSLKQLNVGVRGSLERDISSLRAFGPGGGQISRVVHVSARAAFGVFAEKSCLFMHINYFYEQVAVLFMTMCFCVLRKSKTKYA